jgi:2-keto-4-pentenoate hydratase/2-oxohepta-3-ene-1,7-dioic acid hydratase in catechol pathway
MTRLFRIEYEGRPRYVIAQDQGWRLLEGDVFGSHEAGDAIPATGHRLLAPVEPSKIVAVGLNYKDHAAEQNKPLPAEPLIFIKPSTSVVGPGDPIVIPDGIGRVDHEAEAGVVIGTRAAHVSEADAHRYILGLTCVNDSARASSSGGTSSTRARKASILLRQLDRASPSASTTRSRRDSPSKDGSTTRAANRPPHAN